MCPSPMIFAEHFIENCGMHILLFLCINSPLGVISMCLKLIDILSSLKKTKKLNIETDIIPFLSNIILAKIKEKPVISTPSGKGPKLLPSIAEELEANIHGEKEHGVKKKRNSNRNLDFKDEAPETDTGILRMSTQKFSSSQFGLEVDVDEANKGFDNEEKEDDPFEDDKRQSIAAKFRKEMMLDDNILNQTKEVPPGPKSKSVPRNQDFFGVGHHKEESKNDKIRKSKPSRIFNPFGEEEKKEELFGERDEESPNIISESGAPTCKNMKGVIEKRFAFLGVGDKEEEDKKEPQKEERKNKLVVNPAATGATEFQSDSSSERSEVLNFNKGKTNFKKPMIDTDRINEMFNYGGERGDLLIRVEDEEEKNEKFMKELDSIAAI